MLSAVIHVAIAMHGCILCVHFVVIGYAQSLPMWMQRLAGTISVDSLPILFFAKVSKQMFLREHVACLAADNRVRVC